MLKFACQKKLTEDRKEIAILLPRTVQKMKYLDMDILPENIRNMIGETMDNGFISVMYVDEVKGIEFDKVFVVSAKMRRNEKYIAYTRALSELIIVVDEKISDYKDDATSKEKKKLSSSTKIGIQKKKSTTLKWEKKDGMLYGQTKNIAGIALKNRKSWCTKTDKQGAKSWQYRSIMRCTNLF